MTRKKATGNTEIVTDSIQFKDYRGLHRTYEYDKPKATLLAEAMTELVTLKKREKYLQNLLAENSNLKPFLWGSMDGRVQAIHDIPDDHLKNILKFLPANGREVPKEIKAEALSRGFEVSDEVNPRAYTAQLASGIDDFDDEWFIDDDQE